MTARRRQLVVPARFEAPLLTPRPQKLSADEHERETLRAEARRAGRQEGLQAARAEVDAALAAQHAAAKRLNRVAAALEEGAADLSRRDALTLRAVERQVVELAVQLAEEIVGAELHACDDQVRAALERAMAFVPDRGDLVVRAHPDDTADLGDTLASLPGTAARAAAVVTDPTVERGGCIVDVGPCRVDAQLGPALQRLRVVLST